MNHKEFYINCPRCQKNIKIKVIDEMDETKFNEVISKKIFKFKCNYCKNEIQIDYPTTFIGKNYIVSYKTKSKKSDYEYLRICNDFDDFKEKLLIFSHNLNDILIEFIKDYLRKNIEDNTIDIRFDSINDDVLVFYMMEKDKYIGFKMEQYQQLLNHSKIKKINNFKEINNHNYYKYIKVRK